ncbi:metallophosphoesterase [Salinivibrio sp. YCSC6]|uniref:metallophosphoesterase family protein n=1 Tax=Salinivibrio sp. YCSC6 TaxID=2003370 RepID=UPI000BBC2468|nr:YfcE family phosphodiesterase [Salinivibrio sp. YCSC6]PCE67638.1 hypothetical protein B6G00_04640 [Salinivibrio sp. YCSC6]QCF35462.1 metallophosphoesterase family protein [Salinivibrio sp. YCSC6]
MKIAILSDIHANFTALEAVGEHMRKQGCEYHLILGDLVGYYYQPKAVIDFVRELPNLFVIQGNHEQLLLRCQHNDDFATACHKKYGSGLKIALDQLENEDLDWIKTLPQSVGFEVEGIHIGGFHGSDKKTDEYLYPDTKRQRINQVITDYDYAFFGHTHYPVTFINGTSILVNPGSVGQPRDVGSLASYVILNTENRALTTHRVPFDSTSLCLQTQETDPHYPYLSKILKRNNIHVDC